MPLTILPDTQHQEDDFSLDPRVVQALWTMEENHFWHQARNRWIVSHLRDRAVPSGSRILEVGCGSGWVAGHLQRCGYRVTGIDTALVLVQKAAHRFPDVQFVAGQLENLAVVDPGPFDVIAFFDVLEHLDSPLGLLKTAVGFARPGALVAATVPAIASLFSVVDTLSGHKRRYDSGELLALLQAAKLHSVQERGIFRWLLPLMRRRRSSEPPSGMLMGGEESAMRLAKELAVPPPLLNSVMALLCRLEQTVGKAAAARNVGASLVASGFVE